jgi:hypothetical protein
MIIQADGGYCRPFGFGDFYQVKLLLLLVIYQLQKSTIAKIQL